MKNLSIKRMLASVILSATLLLSVPIGINAVEIDKTQANVNQWIQTYLEWKYNDATGNSIKNAWLYDKKSGKYYYLGAEGIMSTSCWVTVNGGYYYINADGTMATNTTINGYTVGANGVWDGTTPSGAINPIIINNDNNIQSSSSAENAVKSIKTVSDLYSYLNQYYSSLETPIGTLKFTTKVGKNDFSNDMFDYDYWIQTYYGNIENSKYNFTTFLISDLDNSKISESDKEKTKELLKDYQEKVAEDVMKCFPNEKIKGGFYDNIYKYDYIRVDEHKSYQFLSWKNYKADKKSDDYFDKYNNSTITDFHWNTKDDGYNFIDEDDNNNDSKYNNTDKYSSNSDNNDDEEDIERKSTSENSNNKSISSISTTSAKSDDYNYSFSTSNEEYVHGYYRNGKYVQPHYRTKKDSTTSNNYSHKGNTNPHNGKKGYSRK